MELKLERDRSLVQSPCLRFRTPQWDLFAWWSGRPRFAAHRREPW